MIQSCLELERGIVVMIPDIGKLIDKTKKKLEHVCKYKPVILTPSQWNDITTTYEKLYPKTTVYQVGGHTLIIENKNADDESENTGAIENDNDDQVTYISCQEFPVLSCLVELDKALFEVKNGIDKVCKQAGLKRLKSKKEPNIFGYLPCYLENGPADFIETVKKKVQSQEPIDPKVQASVDQYNEALVEQYNKLKKVLEGETDEKSETGKSMSLSRKDLDNLSNFLFKLEFLKENTSKEEEEETSSKEGEEEEGDETKKKTGVKQRGNKKLDRPSDWKESILYKVAGFIAAASSGRDRLLKVFAIINLTYDKLEFGPEEERTETSGGKSVIKRKTGGENLIFYGAPGTGKSYAVRERAKEAGTEFCTVTVFHPDVQNSDFVGCLKPVKTDDKAITYQFAPGPFAIALKNAWLDPEHMHYLVIEEMNRAPAASVFGELFLLLDRDEKGYSIYETDFPSPEFCSWWKNEIVEKGAGKVPGLPSRLKLPSNLSIFATLNSADQGVFPLDTAFRRRWEYKYIQIDYSKAPGGDIELFVKDTPSGPVKVGWKDFVQKLNNFLVNNVAGISEDRLIGTYFLSKRDFANSENLLPEKLLVYIWDDLLRHNGRQELFDSSVRTFGDLSSRQKDKKVIFSESFLELFGSHDGDDQ